MSPLQHPICRTRSASCSLPSSFRCSHAILIVAFSSQFHEYEALGLIFEVGLKAFAALPLPKAIDKGLQVLSLYSDDVDSDSLRHAKTKVRGKRLLK